jgi:hypothetical protein
LILSRFWKWYISGFASKPNKLLYQSPRFHRILLTVLIIGFVGGLFPDPDAKTRMPVLEEPAKVSPDTIESSAFKTQVLSTFVVGSQAHTLSASMNAQAMNNLATNFCEMRAMGTLREAERASIEVLLQSYSEKGINVDFNTAESIILCHGARGADGD